MESSDLGIHVESFAVGPLKCNCTIIANLITSEAVIIDPGGDHREILDKLESKNLKVAKVFHTHAHFDHFLASAEIRRATGAKLGLHTEDVFLWNALETQCRMFGIPYTSTPPVDFHIRDDDEIPLTGCCGVAIHTPGHTPGSMSFLFEEAKTVIAGDTLFRQGIGRTDLWGGDSEAINTSIRDRLFRLDDDLTVVTGHGPSTTIGFERENNPFVR